MNTRAGLANISRGEAASGEGGSRGCASSQSPPRREGPCIAGEDTKPQEAKERVWVTHCSPNLTLHDAPPSPRSFQPAAPLTNHISGFVSGLLIRPEDVLELHGWSSQASSLAALGVGGDLRASRPLNHTIPGPHLTEDTFLLCPRSHSGPERKLSVDRPWP